MATPQSRTIQPGTFYPASNSIDVPYVDTFASPIDGSQQTVRCVKSYNLADPKNAALAQAMQSALAFVESDLSTPTCPATF